MNKLYSLILIIIGVIGLFCTIFYTINLLLLSVFTGKNLFLILAILLPLIVAPSCVCLIRFGHRLEKDD
ncbi:MAG: hypothetical protein RLZZ139_4153 [Cyanobacteriota bacterium]|jgi:hypothetical protein